MIPKEALKLAMDAGWKPEVISENITHHWFGASQNQTISLSNTALDPTFWQALGKALGWLEWTCKDDGCYSTNDTGKVTWPVIKTWQFRAKRFYDLILIGGDIKTFWQELLDHTMK